jgi:hypothetical protein
VTERETDLTQINSDGSPWNRNSVDRLFRLDHASRLDRIEAAAGAPGRAVRAELVDRGREPA